jgi:hypothetical protein
VPGAHLTDLWDAAARGALTARSPRAEEPEAAGTAAAEPGGEKEKEEKAKLVEKTLSKKVRRCSR